MQYVDEPVTVQRQWWSGSSATSLTEHQFWCFQFRISNHPTLWSNVVFSLTANSAPIVVGMMRILDGSEVSCVKWLQWVQR